MSLAVSLPAAARLAGGLAAAACMLAAPPAALAGAPPARAAAVEAVADTMLVARHDLARGVVLAAADIDTVVTRGAATARGGSHSERAAPGWTTRRVIRAGEPLRAPAVQPPPLIASGATVTVVWEHGGLRLTRYGTTLGAAQLGERVLVRVDAQRRVAGIASAAGVVTVVQP